MKTKFFLSIILALSSVLCALSQIPQGFNYQAIARDASGNPITNTAMQVRITIQSSQTGGTIFWQELHSSVTTNDFGMLTLVVGQGTREAGTAATFADIDWSVTPKYIKTEIDYGGWKDMGVSPLWSVPYAQVAKSSEQWQTNGTNIFRSSGNVGIGTSNPTVALDVNGQSVISSTLYTNWIEVSEKSTGNRYSGIDFHGDDTYTDYSLRIYRYNTGPDAYSRIWHRGLGPLQLFTNESAPIDFHTTGSHRLRIAADGNIGIGTSTPAYKLDVNGEVASRSSNAFRLRNSSYSTILRNDNSDFYMLLTDSGNPDGTWNALRPFRLNLSTGNVYIGNGALTVYHGGNVGIGTTTPSSRMVIQPTGTWDDNIPIFEVKNKIGVPILAVYNNGVKILVEDTDGKGVKGGFAIGGFDPTKGAGDETVNLMTVSADSIRLFIDNSAGKGVKGGFAIGSFDDSKGVYAREFMNITPQASSYGQYNTFIGNSAGKSNTTGAFNTFIGNLSGFANNTGNNNTFIGLGAGSTNISGGNNTAIGTGAGISMKSGFDNIFIGKYSGYNEYVTKDGTGSRNIFIGDYSGAGYTTGYDNVLIGTSAGFSVTTGNNNVALGNYNLRDNSTGIYNVSIGAYAGFKNQGNGNVFIGSYAGYNETGSNKLYIDNSDTNSPLIWGNFVTDGTIQKQLVISGNNTHNSSNRRFFVNGTAGGTSGWYNDSDMRLKTSIADIPYALERVLKMHGIEFEWKEKENREKGKQIGFIGQELINVLPEVVDNTNDHYSVQYGAITALLVEAIKEQQKIIESQKEELEFLKERLAAIEERLENK